MRTKFILAFLIITAAPVKAQIVKEWLQQTSTQREYLLEQIAELKIYLEATKKGYQIAKQGLSTISSIKKGEFDLHKNRFDSLLIVKPSISSLARLKQITDLHGQINEICRRHSAGITANSNLEDWQRGQIQQAFLRLYDDSQSVISSLFLAIRHGQVSMTDDQRLDLIGSCLVQMQQNYSFARDLKEQTAVLSQERKNEKLQIENIKSLYNIP
ncbi:hypothetical protein DSL64_28615 [Dyadobacter luteus]|uniref:TerB family tellurite resistance protein n=1 Tax=Dyadobacter luteus TaxID=2259619 RepID=A0A3D8Y348_9BACT|nr:hypothetical protein [Dyadobacter luteus]REA55064.1 hypothetical protein DSL64_28615 [Dyadobacter luteus]